MPTHALRPCLEPHCPTLVRSGRCFAHARTHDLRRGSSTARGYSYRWSQYRLSFLNHYPLCGDRPAGAPETTDSRCRAAGRITPAVLVDHIVPVTGPDDPTFYQPNAHQSPCDHCHQAKRQRESRQTSGAGDRLSATRRSKPLSSQIPRSTG
jgi:5-methylcytosine-specific restriction protein A